MLVPGRATLTPIALAALELLHEGPRHPYEIHQTLRDREVWRLLKITAGSLYHAVERLERDGLIEIVETSREGRRPERTTYRLTGAGRDAFAERLRAMLAEPAQEYPQFALAVAFLHTLDRADAVAQLRRRETALAAKMAAERVYVEHLTEQDVHPLFWPDVELRLVMREAELTWTRRLLARLERDEISWPALPGVGDGAIERTPKLRLATEATDEEAAS